MFFDVVGSRYELTTQTATAAPRYRKDGIGRLQVWVYK